MNAAARYVRSPFPLSGGVRLIAATALGVLLMAAPSSAHTRLGGYQDMARTLPKDWKSPYPLLGGTPIVDYGSFRARNPVTTSQYGLASWSLWVRYGHRSRLRDAMRAARWLVRHQHRDGTWRYAFRYRVPGTDAFLEEGWASGLAQGQAVSLLRRAYSRASRVRFLRAGRRALRSLRKPAREGGLARWYRNHVWFEEYPLPSSRNLVLNGMQQTVLGLYDMADKSRVARRLYRRGVESVAVLLPLFDAPSGRSYYSLGHLFGYPPLLAPEGYHVAHAALLRQLNALSPHAVFLRYAKHWEATAQAAGGAGVAFDGVPAVPRGGFEDHAGTVLGADDRPHDPRAPERMSRAPIVTAHAGTSSTSTRSPDPRPTRWAAVTSRACTAARPLVARPTDARLLGRPRQAEHA
jgi:hypothetical protein